MRVLYVNHTAQMSGGERSLLSLLTALPDTVQPLLATPAGPLQAEAEALGIPTTRIAGTAGSLKLHPLHTSRALIEMVAAALRLRRAARRHRADVVHGNSIRAGVIIGLARLGPIPTVVHVRDCLPPGRVTSATMRLIAATATIIVANSRYTARSVRAAAPAASVEVLHNPVDLERWNPAAIDRSIARERLGTPGARRVLLGVVAQLSPWKGQDTAIEALGLMREQGVDAHLLLIGSARFVARATRFDNEAYLERLRRLVSDAGLGDRVSMLGERDDVPELVRALDVLLLPSWEEPFGRALIEAMALGVPVVATSVGGPAEIIEDGLQGYLVEPHDAAAWAHAIRRVLDGPDGGAEMGRSGRRRVEQAFAASDHAAAMLALYRRAIAEARSAR